MGQLTGSDIDRLISSALAEDVGSGDATTLSVVPAELQFSAQMAAREEIVLCGIELAGAVFKKLSPTIQVHYFSQDRQRLGKGEKILSVDGDARAILTGERLALNLVQRLSGIATLTRKFVEETAGTKAKILDTRKTTPGLRRFEKYAVECGGAQNHRFGLFDLILIKDNHLAALREASPNPIAAAVSRARTQFPNLKVEVETDNLEQVRQAVEAGADIILLDNMSVEQLREAVGIIKGRALTEASGGVNLKTVKIIAATGVDYISSGALTHSASSVDIGLDFADHDH